MIFRNPSSPPFRTFPVHRHCGIPVPVVADGARDGDCMRCSTVAAGDIGSAVRCVCPLNPVGRTISRVGIKWVG